MCKPPFGFTGIAGNRASGDKAVSIFTNKWTSSLALYSAIAKAYCLIGEQSC
jgi:hypothetical protein